MRVAFFGSSQFSCHVLGGLLASAHEVAVVVTQPDQPAGRRMQLRPTPVCEQAQQAGRRVLKPRRLRGNARLLDALRALELDALAVASYGKIIPPELLNLTPWPLNVHPSALPLLRGPSPLRTALLQGLRETQVCIMRMTPRIDDGPLLLRAALPIPAEWNHSALEQAAGELGGRLLVQALELAQQGRVMLEEQDHAQASYTSVHNRADTWIDWTRSNGALADFVRAWDPDAGACTSYRSCAGPRRLKLWRARSAGSGDSMAQPGQIIEASKHELLVQTGGGALSLLEVQPESRSRMAVDSFLAGGQLSAGDLLGADELLRPS